MTDSFTNGFLENRSSTSVPVTPVLQHTFDSWLARQTGVAKNWIEATGFRAQPGSLCLIPGKDNRLAQVMAGIESAEEIWACSGLPMTLPEGDYHLDVPWSPEIKERLSLGWGLGAYGFTRYKQPKRAPAKLALDPACNKARIQPPLEAITLIRDLINTPADAMMPEHLADTMVALGRDFGARVQQTVGDDLLDQNYPVIHAVGRASQHPPRLLDLRWGEETHPKLTLVGKGVCFDSGGLDIKPASGMRLMKKDMGGAAHALGLARWVMSVRLPVRLRVLIPAVENAVAGNAFHPGDVLRSRNGLTIEIDNTDAEGRLILCDALAEASAENPALLIDFATLTGAARVALGTEIPALFSNSDELAAALTTASEQARDPLWRLPLHTPYREMLNSAIADIANSASSPFAGAITAGLFLREFVPPTIPWAHFDLMAWNLKSRPGRPEGGEAMGVRAVFSHLRQRFENEE
jgi:leucyl aminopeptidase